MLLLPLQRICLLLAVGVTVCGIMHPLAGAVPDASPLSVTLSEKSIRLSPNTVASISAKAELASDYGAPPQDISEATTFRYETSVGYVRGHGPAINLFGGPKAGNGTLKVTAYYKGLQSSAAAAVTVNGDKANIGGSLSQCLGDMKITMGRRLNLDEIGKAKACFASVGSVVPANLAPADPDKLKNLKTNQSMALMPLVNPTERSDRLVVSGRAPAGKPVLVYVFSTPLVFATTADRNGLFNFSITTPLPNGKHTVYAASEIPGGGLVRSNGQNFRLAPAPAGPTNPYGLSLALQRSSPAAHYMPLIIMAGLVSLFGCLYLQLHMRRQAVGIAMPGHSGPPFSASGLLASSPPLPPPEPVRIPLGQPSVQRQRPVMASSVIGAMPPINPFAGTTQRPGIKNPPAPDIAPPSKLG